MKQAICLLGLPAIVSALSYAGNLNYFSPSLHHPSLGVSIRKVAARSYANSPWDPQQLNFTHGVASGDPYEDSVILWTRVAPKNLTDNDHSNVTVSGYVELYSHETDEYVKASKAPVCVDWKISASKDMQQVKDSGTVYTSSDVDFTVKVSGLHYKRCCRDSVCIRLRQRSCNHSPLIVSPLDDLDVIISDLTACCRLSIHGLQLE